MINPRTLRVTRHIPVPIAQCAGPQGMAIGPNNQIMLGCNAAGPDGRRNTIAIDATSGSVVGFFQDLGGLDAVTFNPGNGLYFLPSCNTACRTVGNGIFGSELLGVVDSNTLQVVQSLTIASQNGATTVTPGNPRTVHSVAADPNSLNVFLPIPAVGGTAPQFAPTLCDSRNSAITVIGGPSTVTGCIAILGPTTTDVSSVPPGQGMSADLLK